MKRFIKIIAFVAIILPVFATPARADILEGAKLTMSTSRSAQSSNHVYTFTKNTAGTIGKLYFQWCKEAGSSTGTCTTTNVGDAGTLSSITFGGGADESSEWTFTWDGTNIYTMTHETDSSGTGVGEYIVTINSVQNPTYDNCSLTKPADSSTGTCFVRIFTYSDSATATIADSNNVTATVTQPITVSARVDPVFTLSVALVGLGVTKHTSITTDVATTVTTIPFGNLTPGTPTYAAHTLTVVSNTQGGYAITTQMEANLSGQAYDLDIDPFAGTGVTSTNAVAWESPDGTTAGTDTGWLGVATDDTDVTGAAEAQFFPVSTSSQNIGSASTTTLGDTMEIVFAIEVNAKQSADNYTGTMVYNAIPVY